MREYGIGNLYGMMRQKILWTPAEIVPALWLDASDSDTSESGDVLTWDDISGNGNSAVGMSSSFSPSVSTGALGECIRFDSDVVSLTTEVTARAVLFICDELDVVYQDQNATVVPICADASDTSYNHIFIRSNDIDDYDISIDGSASDSGTVYVDGESGVSGGNIDVGLSYDRLNAHMWLVVFDQDVDVGYIGRIKSSTTLYYLTGDVYGFVALTAVPSSTEIDKLFGWAAHKWGLPAKLPSDHPYKSTPPAI
jgi:hypothetical protein